MTWYWWNNVDEFIKKACLLYMLCLRQSTIFLCTRVARVFLNRTNWNFAAMGFSIPEPQHNQIFSHELNLCSFPSTVPDSPSSINESNLFFTCMVYHVLQMGSASHFMTDVDCRWCFEWPVCQSTSSNSSLWPSDAIWCYKILLMARTMVCRWFDSKLSPKVMMAYCQWTLWTFFSL